MLYRECVSPDIRNYKKYIAHALIFCLGIIVFGNSYNNSFAFDDTEAIIKNGDVSNSGLKDVFLHDFWGSNISSPLSHKSYRPLTILSFKFNHWLSDGLNPISFHVTNILLYGIVSVLFLMFFSVLFNHISNGISNYELSWHSFCSAFLFTLHPLHSENVSAIVGRADLICSIFFLLSFFSYIRILASKDNCFEIIVCASFFILFSACSLLSKEQGVTVLGLCFLYDIVLENRIFSHSSFGEKVKRIVSSRSLLLRIFGLVVLSVIFLITRWKVMGFEIPKFQKFDNPHSFIEDPLLRLLNYNYLYCLNAWIAINPWWLCFDWSMGCVPIIKSFTDWRIFTVILFNVVLTLIILASIIQKDACEKNLIMISIGIIIIPFLPASNFLFRVGFVIAERNLLISSSGVCMLVVSGMFRLRTCFKRLTNFMFAFLLFCYFVRSVQRSSHWLNEKTLFCKGTLVCPLNAKVHYNVAKVAADEGNVEVAFKRYHLAIRLSPEYDQALNNLGNLYKERGNFTLAESFLMKAVSIRPDFAAAWMNLGIVQMSLKNFKLAESSFKTALAHKVKYPDCHYNFGNLYLELGDHVRALSEWRNATLQNPHHISAWTNILILLDNLELFQDIDIIARKALTFNPTEASLYFNYANSLGKIGRYEESEKNFLLAIKYQENVANYHSNLGVLYHRWNKLGKAEKQYKIAMKLDSNNSHLINNYKLLQNVYHK